MLLERFRYFVRETRKNERLTQDISELDAYRQFENKWYDENNDEIADQALIRHLNYSISQEDPWKPVKSNVCYYAITELQAVVALTFHQRPKKPKRLKHKAQLETSLAHAKNQFDATHQRLTGLLNQASFESEVDKLIQQISFSPATVAADVEARSNLYLHLMMIDVDNFKQVNDTYGHIYGNKVLQALGRRLHQFEESKIKSNPNFTTTILSHLSGEEFALALIGNGSKEELLKVAEEIRAGISNKPLPSDGEWNALNDNNATEDPPLPLVGERNVTVSIGCTSAKLQPGVKIPSDIRQRLLRESEKALYSSKNGGRNRARHFDDILAIYGRVLEHDIAAGVVAIDIGRDVGVQRGQEFHVYHPKYTGQTPFYFSDGRTQKSIGMYPKYAYSRVTVFDVQQEMSFCLPSREFETLTIEFGSKLEAIPLGAISHLISTALTLDRSIASASLSQKDELKEALTQAVGREEPVIVVVFAIKNAAKLEEDRGSAALNFALAKLYEAIDSSLSSQALIAQVSNTEIGVLLPTLDAPPPEEFAQSVINKAVEGSKKITGFLAGICDSTTIEPDSEIGDKSIYSPKNYLELAQYAVSDDFETNIYGDVRLFDTHVLRSVLNTLRRKQTFERTRAVYENMISLGAQDPYIENQMGLAAHEADPARFSISEQHLRKAVALGKNIGIVMSNLGLLLAALNRWDEAVSQFKKAMEIEHYQPPPGYMPAYAIALAMHAMDANNYELAGEAMEVIQALSNNSTDEWVDWTPEDVSTVKTRLTAFMETRD